MRRSLTRVLIALALLALPAATRAQSDWSERLDLDVHGNFSRIGGDDSDSGIGFGAGLSYMFGSYWGILASYDRAALENPIGEYNLRHVDIGLRFHPIDARIVPVVIAAWTWRAASWEQVMFLGEETDVRIHGTGPTLGAGLSVPVTGSVTLAANALWTGGAMDRVTVRELTFREEDSEIHASSLRFNVGATLTLLRRR